MNITSIEEIADNYDLLLLDVWGVLFDGRSVYPYSIDAFHKLKELGKKISILSNAPRPRHFLAEALTTHGYDLSGVQVVSSGQFFIDQVHNPSVFSEIAGNRAYVLGSAHHPLIKTISSDFQHFANIQEKPNDIDFLIMVLIAESDAEVEKYLDEIRQIAKLQVPCFCPNPDKVAPHGSSYRRLAGYFANEYEKLGGPVHYFGKPYTPIYDYTCMGFADVPKEKILMIGDGMETDILGAHNYGIDSLLVQGGILGNQSQHEVRSILSKYDHQPNYVIDYFRF